MYAFNQKEIDSAECKNQLSHFLIAVKQFLFRWDTWNHWLRLQDKAHLWGRHI